MDHCKESSGKTLSQIGIDKSNRGKKLTLQQKQFVEQVRTMQHAVHANAISKGWWDADRSDGELIALQHAELSECLEALRDGNGDSQKVPGILAAEEEMADAVIRIMDHCEARGWNLGKAIIAKHEYNKTRTYKHGGKAF